MTKTIIPATPSLADMQKFPYDTSKYISLTPIAKLRNEPENNTTDAVELLGLVQDVFGELYKNGLVDAKRGLIESRCDPVALSRLLRAAHAVPR